MSRARVTRPLATLPTWIKPELAALVKKTPDGPDWLHEIKLDGYRMHARLDAGRVKILTRRGNDWTDKYPSIAKALTSLPARAGGGLDRSVRRALHDDRHDPLTAGRRRAPARRGITAYLGRFGRTEPDRGGWICPSRRRAHPDRLRPFAVSFRTARRNRECLAGARHRFDVHSRPQYHAVTSRARAGARAGSGRRAADRGIGHLGGGREHARRGS